MLRARALLPLAGPDFSGKVEVDVRSRDAEAAPPQTPEMQHTRVAVDVPLEAVLPFNTGARPVPPTKTTMFVTQEMQLGGESALPFGPAPEDTTTHDGVGPVEALTAALEQPPAPILRSLDAAQCVAFRPKG